MSTLKGEQSLKKPLSFEFTWTARHLLEVMEERAEAIYLGGLPGEFGVDLRLIFSDREEHHQVKRSFGSKCEWTMSALGDVLTDFRQRLADPKVHCWFVSAIPATRLGYLADKARDSDDLDSFQERWLTGDYGTGFHQLTDRWGLPPSQCWHYLKRVHTSALDERQVESGCLTMLRMMVASSPEDAWAHLRDFCFDHTHKRVTASVVWRWLEAKGVIRHFIPGDTRVIACLQNQTNDYLSGIRGKLIKPPLKRHISETIVSTLDAAPHGEDVVVLGAPGGGKSAVMLQIAEACMAKGWPVLAFRLDELSATLTSTELQQALQLPIPPAMAIAKASAGNPTVVIIDQLDAVSQYSGRTGTLFERTADLIEQIHAHQLRYPIHLVIACREVDWRQDGRFRRLHRAPSDNQEEGIFKVEELSDDEIKAILANVGYDAASFSPKQRELLLRRPQYLALLVESHPDAEELQNIVTPKQLFDEYWRKKELALAHDFPAASNVWHRVLKCITQQLAKTALAITPAVPADGDDAPLAVKKSLLADFPAPAVRWLISNGVLAESKSRYRFGHESFFDYCFARFFEEGEQSLAEYLLDSDQTLIQRGQVRQVLAYQRDEDLASYLQTAGEILEHRSIRPHLKHLVATVLCDVAIPKEEEWRFLAPYIEAALADIDAGNRTSTACQILYAFHGSAPLFRMACESGSFAKWLQNSGPRGIETLFRTLHAHQEKAQKLVWTLIKPLIGDSRFEAPLKGLSQFCHASDSRETFDWMLGMMRKLYASDDKPNANDERFYSLASDLSVNRPEWLAEWLAALIVAQSNYQSAYRYKLLRPFMIETDKIAPAVEKAPRAFLECFLPAIDAALEQVIDRWSSTLSDFDNQVIGSSIEYHSPDRVMFGALVDALGKCLRTDRPSALPILNRLRTSNFAALRRLNAAVLCQDQDESATLATDFLVHDDQAFETTLGGRLAACDMIAKHTRRLSLEQCFAIQHRILAYWPPEENEKRQNYNLHEPKECLGNWKGYRQKVLLAAFPPSALQPASLKRLEEWNRKFASVERLSRPQRQHHPINKDKVIQWSPARFLSAIVVCRKRAPVSSWRGRDEPDGKISSILTEAVAKRPEEFISFLSQCDQDTPPAFIESIWLSNLTLEPAMALEAARQFRRLGARHSRSAVWMLGKIKEESWIRQAFPDALYFAMHGDLPVEHSKPEEGKRGDHLDSMAFNSVRGSAIETLAQYLWAVPELVEQLNVSIPRLMSEKHPAIQSRLAMLCYAIAFKEENRGWATELFERLIESATDEHVLSSHWPFKFMHAGLSEDWPRFRAILERMMTSSSSEIRSKAARLVCFAVFRGLDAVGLAKQCITSADPNVRVACADAFSYNMDENVGKPWTTQVLLTLANDPDKDVCKAVSSGFQSRRRTIDFASLADFLPQYVRSRAFVLGSGSLIDAIITSDAVLPSLVLDLIETALIRALEPVENDSDRIIWHLGRLSEPLTRIYQENRDAALRCRVLDLIDMLCVQGAIRQTVLDQ